MLGVSIIGLGRVGGALALSLPNDRYIVRQVIYREGTYCDPVVARLHNVPEAVRFDQLDVLTGDIAIISTQDYEIDTVVSGLIGKTDGLKAVFHTSGSKPSTVLSSLRRGSCQVGSIHPLVSIARPEVGLERFRGAYFCVEGDPAATRIARELVDALGGRPFTIDTKHKVLYHAAAVTAAGHVVALFDAAVEMMTKCGLSYEESKAILLPLIASTVRNLETQSNAAALTGTFARADTETMTSHLTALNESVSDDLLELYLLLGERSLELAAMQGISSERIEMMRAKVAIAKSKLKW